MGYAGDREDVWLLEQFPEGYQGYAVELGALDGTFLSNTKMLEERGWTVLCIEPNPRHQEALRAARKLVFTCACDRIPKVKAQMWECDVIRHTKTTFEGERETGEPFEVAVLTLDQCLMVAGFPRLDVLSLDVDGIELDIIEGFDIERWKPKAVVIEAGVPALFEPFTRAGYREVGRRYDENRLLLRGDA